MSEAWRVASITYFEQVPVGVADALLRVAAISTIDARPEDPRPMLIADDGGSVARYDALPAPPDVGPDLRCAYTVSIDLDPYDTVFSLELDDGNVIALSQPTLTAPVGGSTDPAEWEAEEIVDEVLEPAVVIPEEPSPFAPDELTPADEPSRGLLLDATSARAELAAMRELQALRPGGTRRRRPAPPTGDNDADGRVAELQLWSSELERRLADASTELDAAQRAASRDAAELERLRGELADVRGGVTRHTGGAGSSDDLSRVVAAAGRAARSRAEHDLADATS